MQHVLSLYLLYSSASSLNNVVVSEYVTQANEGFAA